MTRAYVLGRNAGFIQGVLSVGRDYPERRYWGAIGARRDEEIENFVAKDFAQ